MTIGATTSRYEAACRGIPDVRGGSGVSWYMSPGVAPNGVPSRLLATGVFAGDSLDGHPGCFVGAHGDNGIHGKFCRSVLLSDQVSSPALGSHVGVVVRVGAEPQVRGVTTRRIVASMKDEHSRRDVSVRQYPRYSVCGYRTTAIRRGPVPERGSRTPPFQATRIRSIAPREELHWRPFPMSPFNAVFTHVHEDTLS